MTNHKRRTRCQASGGVSVAIGLVLAFLAPAALAQAAPSVTVVQDQSALYGPDETPETAAATDGSAAELGVRFVPTVDGDITALRFYRGPGNDGPHQGTLWSPAGDRLALVEFTTSGLGWQTASLPRPVPVHAGVPYVASYTAPKGHYAVTYGAFDEPGTYGQVRTERGAGVYSYDPGTIPTHSYRNTSYFVDVVVSANNKGNVPNVPPTGPGPSSTPTKPPLRLPRIPWEGGPAYWAAFPRAAAAGWTDPSFFPVVLWHGGISSDAEVQFDKSIGINTYVGMWEGTSYSLFEDNDVFWIGNALNSTFTPESANWVGRFLDDEVDGRFSPSDGRAHLARLANALPDDGRFRYANFTQSVLGTDMRSGDAESFINDFTDAVSTDMYWYTIPYCSWTPYRDVYLTPIRQASCRTASSYGKMMNSLQTRDAADGQLQAPWQFVELLNGGPGGGPFTANIEPAELKGAVMSSLINEARGLVYFNQSLSGPCLSSNVVRQAQVLPGFCGSEQVDAAAEIGAQIKRLAPVLNTQSYVYSFGPDLDTMLKSDDDFVYIFAMADGAPGARTLRLPDEVRGRQVDVLFEQRFLCANGEGTFVDSFSSESAYHVYRVRR